jgi:Lon protease-like protein
MDHPIDSSDIGDFGDETIVVPEVIPIFPLRGTVLLPGEVLPLHIFEPRYRDMVRDALASHRVIGMVEPLPEPDAADSGLSPVRAVGCIGLIAQHQELPDGRFLLWLVGVERFHIDDELETPTRYRKVRVTYIPTEQSAQRLAGIQPLRAELRQLLPGLLESDDETKGLLADQMDNVTDTQLIALACQILELPADRKQEILEAESQTERFMMVYEDVYRHMDLNQQVEDLDGTTLH